MPIRNLTDANPDGWNIGQSALDKIGFYGAPPVPQRSNPCQAVVRASQMGEVVTYMTAQTPAAVAANTTAEQTLTVAGLLTTDFVAAVNKPTAQPGLGICNARASAANTLAVTFSNNTGSSITPTASQNYNVVVLRGFPIIAASLTPLAVPAGTSVEQVFTLNPVAATGTAAINGAGQVTGVTITAPGGSGYVVPPTVVFAGGGPNPADVQTGTAIGLDDPTATAATPYGSGASAVAIIDSTGNVTGVRITNGGAGYQVAPQVSFVGGIALAPGMTSW